MTKKRDSVESSASLEAEDFVESVMSSQRVSRVATPALSSRKQNRSDSDVLDSTIKKPKVITSGQSVSAAMSPGSPEVVVATADIHVDGNPSVEHLICKLSADMHMLFSSLKERMDKLETGVEQRIFNKVSQLLHKRVNSELNRIRKDVDGRLDEFRESIRDDEANELHDMKSKVESVVGRCTSVRSNSVKDITLNAVIRNLPVTDGENTVNKVNSLLKDGLKLKDVTCDTATRKQPTNDRRPGVIIARFKSHEDKRQVMSQKTKLKDHRQYSQIYINHDQSQADRVMSNNFRTILSALKQHGLAMRGSRVVHIDRDDVNSSRRETSSRNDNTDRRTSHGDRDGPHDNHRNDVRDNRDNGRGDTSGWTHVQRGRGNRGGARGGRWDQSRRYGGHQGQNRRGH